MLSHRRITRIFILFLFRSIRLVWWTNDRGDSRRLNERRTDANVLLASLSTPSSRHTLLQSVCIQKASICGMHSKTSPGRVSITRTRDDR